MRADRNTGLFALIVIAIVYGMIIVDSLRGVDPDDRSGGWLLLGVLTVGIVGALAGRLRPAGIARGLTLMAASQVAAGVVMIWQGIGTPWVVVTVNAVLALLVAAFAWGVRSSLSADD